MPEKNTCILLYSSDQGAWQAINKLQSHHFNMAAVSIVGIVKHNEAQPVGIYIMDERMHFQGVQARFWESLLHQLDGALFFLFTSLGVLVAAGPIVRLLVKKQDDIDIRSSLSAIGVALFNIGVPVDSISQYEKAIKAEKLLLIVSGMRSDVERSCEILHSEMQQATVHLA